MLTNTPISRDLAPMSRWESRSALRSMSRTEANAAVEIRRIEAQLRIRLAKVQAVAIEQSATVDAVKHVAENAQNAVAMLSEREALLAKMVPMATTRLEAITDLASFAIAEVVGDTVRKLR